MKNKSMVTAIQVFGTSSLFYSECLTITLKKENRFIHDNKSLKCSYECRIKLYSFIHYLLVKSSFQG